MLVEQFAAYRKARAGTMDETLFRYRAVARLLARDLGDRPIDSYTRDELESVLMSESALSGKPSCWNMRRLRLGAARSMWRFALARGYLPRDTMVGIEIDGEDPRHLPVELPLETLRKILLAARADKKRPWFVDSLTLLALTCLRPVELWRLSWRYVELNSAIDSRLLLYGDVRRKNPTPAIYPLCQEAVEVLIRWRARTVLAVGFHNLQSAPVIWYRYGGDDQLRRIKTNHASRLFNRLVRRIGARCRRGEKVTLYTLRHFYQQLFEGKTTQDVRMYLMGHSTPGIGPKHYMSAMEDEQRKIVQSFPRIG